MSPAPKVLLIDPDPAIRRLAAVLFEAERYRMAWARTAAEGRALALRGRPDAVVLELDLPDAGGLSVLRPLREWSRAPVIVLSTRTAAAEKAAVLDEGANDYLVKPFEGIELLARLRAHLRQNGRFAPDACIQAGPLKVNLATREVSVNGRRVDFSATEEAVFYLLARHVGGVVTGRQCAHAIWGIEAENRLRELQVYIERLRRKLEAGGAEGWIQSVGRSGYRLALGTDPGHEPAVSTVA